MLPLTPLVYKNKTKRLLFMRRPEMADRGLVIVVFDGLVGEFIRPILADSGQSVLYMRAGALSFLRTVAKTSQLVLMLLSVRRRRYKAVLRHAFRKNNIHFDAIYTTDTSNIATDREVFEGADRTPEHLPVREGKREDEDSHDLSAIPYTQVFRDFELNDPERVL